MRNMRKLRLWAVTLLLSSFLFLPIGIANDVPFANEPFDVNNIPEPVPPPKEVRDFFDIDPYYQQWINVRGFPVLASAEVSPYAVKEVAWIIDHMIGHRPDVLRVMAERTVRFSIVPHNKHTSDMPESNTGRLSFFWDVRVRAVRCKGCPIRSATEENLIGRSSSPIHGFGHLLQDWGLNGVDPTFNNRVITLFDLAKAEGLYQRRYAGSTKSEYWAEGVASWFHDTNPKQHAALTRSALKEYDPRLAKLLMEVFGDGDWRYTRPATRTHLPHLQGFNPQEAPIYQRPTRLLKLEAQLKDPTSNGGGKWVNLKLYDPSGLSHIKKLATGRNRTDFIFGNLTGTDLTLYTIDDDGKKTPRYYSTTDDFTVIDTHVGAIWLIQDHTGKGIAVFRAEEEVGRVLITPTTVFITSGLSKMSGDNQIGVSGAVLAHPFVIEVRDESLSVLEGISVSFTVTAGDGTLSATRTTTDHNGTAESTLTLGPNMGKNTVLVSVAGIAQPVIFTAVAEPAVAIPDANLRAAIETALGKVPGTLIVSVEMAALPHLDARNADIRDLTGLKFATNLTYLHLAQNAISDISALVNLTNLTHLALYMNSISDPTPVAGLTNLTYLNLAQNSISDISALANLTNLTHLELPFNMISNLSPLVANTGLGSGDEVDVRGNPLSYLSIHTHIPALQSRGVTVEFDADGTGPPDVNGDGSVDVLDLLVIVSKFGDTGTHIATDISGDGVVDILDLVLVAGMFDGAAAAPSAQPQATETLTAVEVQGWLTDARPLEVRDPIIKRGIMVLGQLLAALTPTETELLANYPNPFNPETWIPYRLAEDAFVTLTIYDLNGRIIRTLDVGHRIASAYESRSKAVYWDGRNGLGEPVASGVYFYTLTAGDYSATRKMMILK